MKVLILGGAGMLGHQIFLKLKHSFGVENVACTLRKAKSHYDRFQIFKDSLVFENVNVLDFSSLKKTLEKFQPQVIINCIGLTLRKPELSDLEKCIQVNSMLPHQLAKWGMTNNCRIIHFSTDCVFDGARGGYLESDVPNAGDLYGQSKFLGEIGYANSLTFRLSIVGRELEGKTELIEWFLSQKGKSVKGFSKALYSGLTTNFVASEVLRVLKDYPQLSGVYQLASEKISKFELLKIMNDVYQTKTAIQDNPDYVSDKSLNCDLYTKTTGFQKPSWKTMIEDMKKEEKVSYENI